VVRRLAPCRPMRRARSLFPTFGGQGWQQLLQLLLLVAFVAACLVPVRAEHTRGSIGAVAGLPVAAERNYHALG